MPAKDTAPPSSPRIDTTQASPGPEPSIAVLSHNLLSKYVSATGPQIETLKSPAAPLQQDVEDCAINDDDIPDLDSLLGPFGEISFYLTVFRGEVFLT